MVEKGDLIHIIGFVSRMTPTNGVTGLDGTT
jgi:hypothetical protein